MYFYGFLKCSFTNLRSNDPTTSHQTQQVQYEDLYTSTTIYKRTLTILQNIKNEALPVPAAK